MKKTMTSLLLLIGLCATAQVKIGDNPTSISPGAALEIESTNKGLVIPRVANTAAITNPTNGMLVYDLSSNCVKFYENGVWSNCISTGTSAVVQGILAQIGLEADSPNVLQSTVTAVQLSQVGVTGVTPANIGAYQAYIDANPDSFSNPATVSEIQAAVTAVNATVTSVLAQIGNEGDNPNTIPCVITITQLESIGITGVTPGNIGAYQAYIDANPDAFSNPATVSEIQTAVSNVNTAVSSVLTQIGNEGDSPNLIPSVVTLAQLNSIGVTGVTASNIGAYQAYIDANPNSFSSPALLSEVQAAVTAVNSTVTSVLAQIGNEGDNPNSVTSVVTVAQLQSIGITGINASNIGAYQAYIDANPDAFSNPATLSEIQSAVSTVNSNVSSVLTQIGNEGDNPNTITSSVTVAQLQSIGITGINASNIAAYQAYIDANPNSFSSPASLSEVQAAVTAVNSNVTSVLAQIGNEGDSPNTVPSVVTAAQLQSIGVTGVTAANIGAYQAYIDANPNSFSSPALLSEVQSAVTAVNSGVTSVLAQIGNEGDNPNTIPSVVTVAQLQSLGITGVTPANIAAYQAYIDANPNSFSSPALLSEVQSAVSAVNTSAATSGGTATVSAFVCNTASAGTLTKGTTASGVTQTITATVTAAGTYNITATANGVTFNGTGTFAGTGSQAIVLTASGTPTAAGSNSFTLNTTPNCNFTRSTIDAGSGGTAAVSAFTCNTASAGTLTKGTAASGVTQTITATVTTVGTYNITATANGVTFTGTGAFAGTGSQNIVLTASGTPTAAGSNSFTLSTTPGCSFTRSTVEPTSGGSAVVSAFTCSTGSNGNLFIGKTAQNVTQTITATVTSVGTYNISATANGITFSGSGTFTGTGAQNIVLTASGTPTTAGNTSFTINTTPNCSFTRTTSNIGITALNCAGSYGDISTTASTAYYYNNTVYIPYTGTAGISVPSETVSSTGVTGLTATMNSFTAAASGNLVYTITGTPNADGWVYFNTSTNGQTCTVATYAWSLSSASHNGASSTTPSVSCAAIKSNFPSSADGIYWVDPDGPNTSFSAQQVYCDMTTDGGGWQLLAVNGNASYSTTATATVTNPSVGGWLARTTVIAMANNATAVQLRTGNSPSSYANKVTSTNALAIGALRNSSTTVYGSGTWHNGASATFTGTGTWCWDVNTGCGGTYATGWPIMYHSICMSGCVHWFVNDIYNRTSGTTDSWSTTWIR